MGLEQSHCFSVLQVTALNYKGIGGFSDWHANGLSNEKNHLDLVIGQG
jgi:hypothetical protein